MKKQRLSKTIVDEAPLDAVRDPKTGKPIAYLLWDSEIKGFALRVNPKGRKSYILYYRTREGQERRPTIGVHGQIKIQQARNIAMRWLGEVAEGKDPSTELQERRQGLTVREFGEVFLKHVKERRSEVTHYEYGRQLEKNIYPTLGSRKIASLGPNDALKLHRSLSDRPVLANRVHSLLRSMINSAVKWGYRPDGLPNPARHVERFKEKARDRYLTPDEWRALAEGLKKAEVGKMIDPWAAAAIRLIMFTGCRKSEVLNLRWSDIDAENMVLRLSRSKTGARPVFLSGPAIEVLEQLYRLRGTSPWVIQGRRKDKPLVGIQKQWERVRWLSGLDGKNVTLHTMRHSYATIGASMGMGLPVVGRLLGHTQAATTMRYAHVMVDPAAEANRQIGARLVELMQGGGAKVVELGSEKPKAEAEHG